MPSSDNYTYIVEEFIPSKETGNFDTPQFDATIHLNLDSKDAVDTWLAEFMKTSKCTYRVTKTIKPAMKRVLVKYTYHCQQYKKPLRQKQLSAHLLARKPSENPLTADIHHKKISNCLSTLVVTIQILTKKQIQLPNKHSYLLTHKTQVTLKFFHNHFVFSAHGLCCPCVRRY